MTDKIFVPPAPIRPIDKPASGQSQVSKTQGKSFKDILADEIGKGLKFSAHAKARLEARNIKLTESQLNRIYSGVDKAASKGARESLVLVDNLALVVSIKNRTVITAVDDKNIKENVFTNIDSAVVM
ncbi:MAG: TIGR02530 family flagellar biosynthesis protein [Actinomycetota bacterium]|nr:TIGR02530 family flagellar biosynthesis protein [Actinomycetota bacterium]